MLGSLRADSLGLGGYVPWPDVVGLDMEYRYRKAVDIGDIVTEDAMAHIAKRLSPAKLPANAVQLVVYNPLPYPREVVTLIDL